MVQTYLETCKNRGRGVAGILLSCLYGGGGGGESISAHTPLLAREESPCSMFCQILANSAVAVWVSLKIIIMLKLMEIQSQQTKFHPIGGVKCVQQWKSCDAKNINLKQQHGGIWKKHVAGIFLPQGEINWVCGEIKKLTSIHDAIASNPKRSLTHPLTN